LRGNAEKKIPMPIANKLTDSGRLVTHWLVIKSLSNWLLDYSSGGKKKAGSFPE
jgi:hypothetical protein